MLLEGKIFAITGGASGIGRAAALEAARQGADVAITDLVPAETVQPILREIGNLGRRSLYYRGDVALAETASGFMSAIESQLGGLDVFVSNAGICPFHAFLDLPAETLRQTVEVNLLGAYFMVQEAARFMVKQGRGGRLSRSHPFRRSWAVPIRPITRRPRPGFIRSCNQRQLLLAPMA